MYLFTYLFIDTLFWLDVTTEEVEVPVKSTGNEEITTGKEYGGVNNLELKHIKHLDKRNAKSAIQKRSNDQEPTNEKRRGQRKVQSAKSYENELDDGDDVPFSDKLTGTSGPPEILKYHREKSSRKRKPPPTLEYKKSKVVTSDTEEPPSTGLFSGPCQFCGKPILTIPTLEQAEQDLPDQV